MQALRNIKYTLRKYFVPMLMSIIGLILAFSAFMLISVQLDFENGFDRFHPDAGNIYRVDLSDNNTIFRSILPPGFSDEVIRSSSHIVAGTVVCPFLGEVYITTMKDGVSSGFIETANVVSEDFFKVFGIKIVEGDPATLSKNEQLAILQSTARKIFGNESPIGKQVKTEIHQHQDNTWRGHPHDTYGDNSGNCPAVAHSIYRSSDCSRFPLSCRHGNGNRKHSVQFREEFFHRNHNTASGSVRRNTFRNISCILRHIIYRRTCNERLLQPQFFRNENQEDSPVRTVCHFVLIDSVHSGNLSAEQDDASVRPKV